MRAEGGFDGASAIVVGLDEGGERLPLAMDEAFVNWDRARLEQGRMGVDRALARIQFLEDRR